MVMVGDMFNNALKARVGALCAELAGLLPAADLVAPAVASASPPGPAGRHRRQHVRAGIAGLGRMVARRARPPGLGRGAERPSLRLLPGDAAPRHRAGRASDGLRHWRSPDRRVLPAAERRPVADLHQPARPSAAGRPACGGGSAAPAAPAPAAPPSPQRRTTSSPRSSAWRRCALKNILTAQEFEAKKAELLSRL